MSKYEDGGGMPGTAEAGGDASSDGMASPQQMGDSKTVSVPADLMPGCKAGDTYVVKSMDNDNVTLEMQPSAGGDSDGEWNADLVKHVEGGTPA